MTIEVITAAGLLIEWLAATTMLSVLAVTPEVAVRDWHGWHEAYDDPASSLARRLAIVQDGIRAALDRCPPGPVRAVSVCAGQGRDLLGVLADHPRGTDVRARLVELDPRNVAVARAALPPGVEVVEGDAAVSDAYLGAVPADLVLLCGVFGNVSDGDVERTVRFAPQLCAPGATVIWTRHRRAPDLTPSVRRWFGEAGFEEVSFDAPPESAAAVGVTRYVGTPVELRLRERFFTFR
jgi:hypothetical protein